MKKNLFTKYLEGLRRYCLLALLFLVAFVDSYAQSDACATPTPVPVSCMPFAQVTLTGQTNVGATADGLTCTGIAATAVGVWYSFVGTGYPVVITTCSSPAFDTEISVWTGACGSLVNVVCSDQDIEQPGCGNNDETATVTTTLGTTYLVMVSGHAASTGTFSITFNPTGFVGSVASSNVLSCTSPTSTLSLTGVPAIPTLTYAWSASGGGAISGPANGATAMATTPGTYNVLVTEPTSGCFSTGTVTVTSSVPQATGATICTGGSGELTSSTVCNASVSTSGSGGSSISESYGAPNVPISITVPAAGLLGGVPLGATVTGVTISITYSSIGTSWRSELRTRVTPPVAYNPQVNDIQPKTAANVTPPNTPGDFTGLIDPNSNPILAPAWPIANPAGTWLFEFRETFDDDETGLVDANITNITITTTYTSAVDWYTAATGGTAIGSGSPFDPVGAAGSPLATTTTSGTTTFYAACSGDPTCRTQANFVINGSAAPTATVTTQPTCLAPTGTITVTAPATGAGVTYTVTGTAPVVAAQTNATGVFTGLAPGMYSVIATVAGCPSAATLLTVNPAPPAPAAPTASVTAQPTCTVGTGTITVSFPTPILGLSYIVTGTAPVVAPQTNTTGVFSGLAPGNYEVRVSALGCTSLATPLTVNAQPATPAVPTASLTTAPTCSVPTGTITVSAPAPAAGLTYILSPGGTTNTTGVFAGLAPGSYTIVADLNGCQSVASAPVSFTAPTGCGGCPTAPTMTLSYTGSPYCSNNTTPQSPTLSTIVIDGVLDVSGRWGGAVEASDDAIGWPNDGPTNPNGNNVNVNDLYVTSDATYIYFGATINSAADWQSWGFAINTIDGQGGSQEVWTYPIVYGHSQLPDFVIKGHFGRGGAPYAQRVNWNGSSWTGFSDLAGADFRAEETGMVEVRILKSDLGNPNNVDVQFYISGDNQFEHATFDAVPNDQVATSWNHNGMGGNPPATILDVYASNIQVNGAYSATPAGITVNPATGVFTPSATAPGPYTITYTIPSSNGCTAQTASTMVTITALPTATISYAGSPFCLATPTGAVTQTGATGGTYSSTAGLTINASTGAITPGTSMPGTYTVTYTIAAASGCPAVMVTTSVTISPNPGAPTAVSPQAFCFLPVPTVASLVATGTNIKWYIASSGGAALATTTPLVNGTTYHASQTSAASCEGTARTPVVVTFNSACFMGGPNSADGSGTITGGIGTSGATVGAAPNNFAPFDPCSCNNNSTSVAQDNGTFNEFIFLTGPSGATITATVTGGTPANLTFTAVPMPGNPAMSTYTSNIFTHVDGIGYNANLFAAGAPLPAPPFSIGSIGNRCIYPNVAIVDPVNSFNNCLLQASTPLTADITPLGMTGTYTWGGIGVTGSNFNPSGLPVGNVATTLSFDADFVNNVWNGVTAANPGCIQVAAAGNIVVTECCVDLGVTITKTAGAVHYDQCVNPEEVIVDVTILLVNTSGRVLNNVYLDEVLNTVPDAFIGLATYPNGILTDADVVPQLNFSWNGTTNPSLFTSTSGVLGIGDFIEVTLSLKFNADLLIIPLIANTASGGGTYMNIGSTCVATGVNATPIDFCPFILLSPPADLTVNACESYDNEIQHWLATYAGATFSNACREVEIICNDYCAPHAWQYLDNCSKNAILPVRFTVKYTDGSTFEFCSVIHKVVDEQVVTFLTPPQNLVLNCSGNNQAAQVQAWLNDNGGAIAQLCEGYIFHSNNYSGALPIGCNSSVPVTFTITNECGFSTSAVANISLIDNTPPLLSGLPANTTINCGDAIPAAPTVTATDACTPNVTVNLSQWVATISGNLSGANEVPANNSSASGRVFAQLTGNSLQIVVAFNGLTAPASAAHIHEAAAGTNGPVRIDLVGLGFPVGATNGVFTTSVTLTAALQTALAAGNLYVNIHNPSFPGGELRAQLRSQCTNTTVRVWSASDACNNSAIAMRTVSETDTQAPTFTSVPASITVACDAATPALGTATATDACSAATVTFSDVTTGTVCTGVTTTRTFRATDGCGNTATAVQSVTKSADTAAPTFTFVPSNNTYACGGIPFLGTATATDACSSVTVTFVDSQGAGNCSGASTIRTFRATDGCGNSATATQESTPEVDVVPPTFGPLTEVIEIVCGDAVVFETATTSDNCTAVTLTHTDEVNGDVCAGIMNIRRWTATDACGNTATAKQTVWQLGDHVDPEFTNQLEDEAVYFCGETPDYDGVGAVDNCGGSVTVSYEIDYDYEDYCYDGYGYYSKVRYLAVDACGNENHETITSHFVPEDHRMAFMYKPVSKTVSCNEAYTFDAVYPKVVSYDGAISSVTYTDIANLTPCGSGTITRRWTATDVVGNSAIAEQTVTILPDTELPTLVLANNSVVVSCATAITVQAPLVSDNCSSAAAITLTYTDVNVENTIQRTWSAADACGNVANATQIYIILDTQAPVFTTALQNKTINCGAPVIFDNAVAADACSAVTMSYADTQLAINCGTEHTRTWTANDAAGNAATIVQKITVVDNAAPIFSYVPANVQVASANLVSFGTPQVADVCQIVQLTFSDVQTTPICANTGYTVTRTWVANDGCNNQAVASQQISVALDSQSPVFSATPVNQFIAFGAPVVFTTLTATDNNGTPTLTYQDVQSEQICGGYSVTRTWTATDACNNVAVAVQKISVGGDVLVPIFSAVLVDQSIAFGAPVVFTTLTATDNNGTPTLTYQDVQGAPICGNSGYTVIRTWTAIDACDNVAEAVQHISVGLDVEAPVFASLQEGKTIDCGGLIAFDNPVVTDNSSNFALTYTDAQTTPTCGNSGYTMTRTYTALDACNNAAQIAQSIFVAEDTEAPVFVGSVNDVEMTQYAFSTWVPMAPAAADNCQALEVLVGTAINVDACNYKVDYTATDACGNFVIRTQNIHIVDCLVLGTDEGVLSGVSVYPNPVETELSIVLSSEVSLENVTAQIFDMLGKEVLMTQVVQHQSSIQVHTLATGSYTLRLATDGAVKTVKFVKM